MVIKEVVVDGTYDSPNINVEKSKLLILKNKTIRILSNDIFSHSKCDLKNEFPEYLRSSQLRKEILQKFFELHLFRYGQYYRQMVIQKEKCELQQKLNK